MSILDQPAAAPQRSVGQTDAVLLERYAAGSLPAREELVRRHMPMARRLASRHRRSSEALEDLEQVAYLGLLKTVDRYDPTAGSFVGYAITTIRGELKRHFRDHGWTLHVTRPLQERSLAMTAVNDELTNRLGRAPTVREQAVATGLTPNEVGEALEAAHGYSPPSLDGPVSTDEEQPGRTLADTVGAFEPGYDAVELGQAIGPAFRSLPVRQQQMVKMRFVEDLTQSEIAGRCGISQMHVSRLLRRSLDELLRALDPPKSDPARA